MYEILTLEAKPSNARTTPHKQNKPRRYSLRVDFAYADFTPSSKVTSLKLLKGSTTKNSFKEVQSLVKNVALG